MGFFYDCILLLKFKDFQLHFFGFVPKLNYLKIIDFQIQFWLRSKIELFENHRFSITVLASFQIKLIENHRFSITIFWLRSKKHPFQPKSYPLMVFLIPPLYFPNIESV